MGFLTVFVLITVVVSILIIILNLRVMKREERTKEANEEKRMEQNQQAMSQAELSAVQSETTVQDKSVSVAHQSPPKEPARAASTSFNDKMSDGHYRMAIRKHLKSDVPIESEKSERR